MTSSRKLTVPFLKSISDQPPPAGSLFWKMWNNCRDFAEKSLNTDYIQGIQKGTLSPLNYGWSMVNDSYYCFRGADDYGEAVKRTTDPDLKDYLLKKKKSFREYNEDFVKKWHIKDASSVVPIQVTIDYADLETKVATRSNYHPIYCLIVNLPCNYLWAWLAGEIAAGSPTSNLYQFWINDNNNPKGAYKMGNYIEKWMKDHPGTVDEEEAENIYKEAMIYEFKGFDHF